MDERTRKVQIKAIWCQLSAESQWYIGVKVLPNHDIIGVFTIAMGCFLAGHSSMGVQVSHNYGTNVELHIPFDIHEFWVYTAQRGGQASFLTRNGREAQTNRGIESILKNQLYVRLCPLLERAITEETSSSTESP